MQDYLCSQANTYSKQACRYVEGIYPKFISQGKGCFLVDTDGQTFIDYTSALGANILGYAHSGVNDAIKSQVDKGTLFAFGSLLEGVLAENINHLFPSIESMRFLKSGSEAVSAGVKIARAYTGRPIVLSNGYHGWHDWSTPITPKRAGTPHDFDSTIHSFKYGDMESLKKLFNVYDESVACVVLDPYIFDEPPTGYFKKLINLAHKHGALVLFDEVVTGVRWQNFSVQNTYDVTPDLTALGKGMANGMPISVIGGKKRIMKVLDEDCFVSSTFGGELASIAAAIATLNVVVSEQVCDRIEESGLMFKEGYNELARKYGLDTRCIGNPARLNLTFPTNDHKGALWQEMCLRGFLFGGSHHTTLAHNESIIAKTLYSLDLVMYKLRAVWNNPKSVLIGKSPVSVDVIAKSRSN